MAHARPDVVTDGLVSAALLLFFHRAELQLGVVVKATFALVPNGDAAHAAPGEIARGDRTFDGNPARSVEIASDLAPYRARCDVTLVGHAHAAGGRPAAAAAVRLGLARDGVTLLDKTLHVFGDAKAGVAQPFTKMPLVYERALGGPGEPNPVGTRTPNVVDPKDARRAAGFAPISAFWPVRKQLLSGADRAANASLTWVDTAPPDAPLPAIPDAMPWDYYQAAPRDQQIEPLRGGEWLVLDGMHAEHARVQTRLPLARAAARVVGVGAAKSELAVELVCDGLAIDADRITCALVWRGHVAVAGGEAALAGARVVAGLATPDRPIDFAALATHAGGAREPAAVAPKGDAEATFALGASDHAFASSRAVAPFALSSRADAPPSTAGLPFAGSMPAPAPRTPSPGEATVTLAGAAMPSPPPFVAPPRPFAAPPPVPTAPAPASAPSPTLEQRLRAAGAGDADVASLLSVLRPPQRPPGDE